MNHHALPAAVLLASIATAQVPWSSGPIIVIPHAFSTTNATAVPGYGPGDAIVTQGSYRIAVPTPPVPGNPQVPDMTTLPWLLAGIALDIDAISAGLDWIRANATGQTTMPGPNQWAGVTFSVTPQTVGLPASQIRYEQATSTAAGDIFIYVLQGSDLPTRWVDRTMRSHDPLETGIGPTPDIDAHDLFLGVLLRDAPDVIGTALVPKITMYFSVTTATSGLIPAAWLTGFAPTLPPTPVAVAAASGADVFSTTWIPTSQSWSQPQLAYPRTWLDLTANDDLDALALDLTHGIDKILFSTTVPVPVPANFEAVRYVSPQMGATSFAYSLPTGIKLIDRLGLEPVPQPPPLPPLVVDDVNAICALDPGLFSHTAQVSTGTPLGMLIPLLSTAVGVPVNETVDMSLPVATIGTVFAPTLIGSALPIAGVAPGFVFFWLDPITPTPLAVSSVVQFPSSFPGDPFNYFLAIPSMPSLVGVSLTMSWWSWGAGVTDFAWPQTFTIQS